MYGELIDTSVTDPRPAPTPWQRKRDEAFRYFGIGLGIGCLIVAAYVMFLLFALSNGQIPWQ